MLSQLLNTPCVITRELESTTTDQYGNEVPDPDEVETVCELQQQQRDEPGGAGEVSRTTWLLVLPAGTAIRTGDSVEVGGATYQMVGDPWHVRNPRTQAESHVEATVMRTAGSEEGS